MDWPTLVPHHHKVELCDMHNAHRLFTGFLPSVIETLALQIRAASAQPPSCLVQTLKSGSSCHISTSIQPSPLLLHGLSPALPQSHDGPPAALEAAQLARPASHSFAPGPGTRASSSFAALSPAASAAEPKRSSAGQPGTGRDDSAASTSGAAAAGGGSRQRRGKEPAVPSGRLVTTTAPWPFIDPLRPMVLPEYLSPTNTRVKKPAVELAAALQQVKVGREENAAALQQVKANAAARIQGTERDLLSGRKRCRTEFDETLEFIANLSVNPRKSDQIVRGAVQLPYGTGKPVTICVFASGPDADAARKAGADLIGDEALIQSIIESGGKALSFDKLIATPQFMKPLARAGKVLGPKGLMPNVKLGTLTSDVAAALLDMRRGRVDFRVDRDGIMHTALGKVSFPDEHLNLNIGAFLASLLELRPSSIPGSGVQGYIKSAFIKSSMTPSIPVTLESCGEMAAAALAKKAAEAAAKKSKAAEAEAAA